MILVATHGEELSKQVTSQILEIASRRYGNLVHGILPIGNLRGTGFDKLWQSLEAIIQQMTEQRTSVDSEHPQDHITIGELVPKSYFQLEKLLKQIDNKSKFFTRAEIEKLCHTVTIRVLTLSTFY